MTLTDYRSRISSPRKYSQSDCLASHVTESRYVSLHQRNSVPLVNINVIADSNECLLRDYKNKEMWKFHLQDKKDSRNHVQLKPSDLLEYSNGKN